MNVCNISNLIENNKLPPASIETSIIPHAQISEGSA